MSASALTVFGSNSVSTKVSAKGYQTVGFVPKKEYGTTHGLKGKELTRAHDKYRYELGKASIPGVIQMLTNGDYLPQSVRQTKNGISINAVRPGVLDIEVAPRDVAAKLTDEELLAIIAERKAAPGAQAPAISV